VGTDEGGGGKLQIEILIGGNGIGFHGGNRKKILKY
jgi:hypothetical protein